MISVRKLSHSYAGSAECAVADITFEVAKGEIFGFLGPNGAGKSTTQKIITGLLPLQTGDVTVGGQDIRHPTNRLFNSIGVSFEQPNIYRKLTGVENLSFHASLYDVPTADPLQLLRLVGLESAANRRAGTYSKGMQQRLVFARSLVNNPALWFLDEPTSGLDPVTTQQFKQIIMAQRDRGTTIFLTTHNMQIADDLCDRVAFLNDGRIATMDTPRNLKLRYGQRVVAVEHRSGDQLKSEMLSLVAADDMHRLQQLIDAGTIETLHSQEATLEEVFIRVTGRGLA